MRFHINESQCAVLRGLMQSRRHAASRLTDQRKRRRHDFNRAYERFELLRYAAAACPSMPTLTNAMTPASFAREQCRRRLRVSVLEGNVERRRLLRYRQRQQLYLITGREHAAGDVEPPPPANVCDLNHSSSQAMHMPNSRCYRSLVRNVRARHFSTPARGHLDPGSCATGHGGHDNAGDSEDDNEGDDEWCDCSDRDSDAYEEPEIDDVEDPNGDVHPSDDALTSLIQALDNTINNRYRRFIMH